MRIDIGIAANKNQDFQWWAAIVPEIARLVQTGRIEIGKMLVVSTATPDWSKNQISSYYLGPATTAENRTAIVAEHLDGPSDAIWWIDDDTVPPAGALERLLAVEQADIAAGIYYLRRPPFNPVCYKRLSDRSYAPLYDFQVGEILEVDSVGMGCTLVRRHVYERIKAGYRLFRRADTGTMKAVHRDAVVETRALAKQIKRHVGEVLVTDRGIVHVEEMHQVDLPVGFPFYVMEFGRTEDHHFCEMARRVGCRIVVDTAVECSHYGTVAVTGEDFRRVRWEAENESS